MWLRCHLMNCVKPIPKVDFMILAELIITTGDNKRVQSMKSVV